MLIDFTKFFSAQLKQIGIVRASLKVHLLVKMNRLSDAIKVLENVVKKAHDVDKPLGQSGEKITFSHQTISTLTKCVEKSGDKILQIKLATVFRKMDAVATLSDKSLCDIITGNNLKK